MMNKLIVEKILNFISVKYDNGDHGTQNVEYKYGPNPYLNLTDDELCENRSKLESELYDLHWSLDTYPTIDSYDTGLVVMRIEREYLLYQISVINKELKRRDIPNVWGEI